MPEVSRFHGIVIAIYYEDRAKRDDRLAPIDPPRQGDSMSRDVTKAEYAGGRALDLTFEDGQGGRVDLSGFAAKGGVFSRFNDLEYFKQGALNAELGTPCWPGGVDIAPETLYALATGRERAASSGG